ncbi:glycosyltransferase family 4 protein [Aliarcobacter skirrowii]|uniref:glycosyltransferase family 4 protein n=1 Tax=Aliarcobacter skirrowii TaxID=28200 RepID=UPI00082EC0D8|nr:glycosyltransferase family 4 protein [Aliarcobacter skirrowii]
MRNKIIIVSNTSWSLFNFRFELAKSLKQKGYEVVLVAPYDEYSDRLSEEFEYHDIYMNNKGTNPKEDIKTTMEFYKLYKKLKPDVVLHYTIKPNIYGTIACSMLGIKTINNIAGLGTLFIKQNFVTKIAKWLYKYSQSKADKIFFQNRDDFEMFTGEGLVEKSKSDVLPGSGVDTCRFVPVEYKDNSNKFKFLLVARMLWDKGIGEYVEASKIITNKYKNVEFQMLGFLDVENNSAVSKEQMQEWVDAGYVNYLGVSDNVKEEIAKADCIVLPSFYREGTPRILLESASMAKPIITTDNVGCRDVVDDGVNGYLCEVRNAVDLAEKMEMMLKLSEEERKVMGEAGRVKMVNEFDERIVIGKYLETLEQIL